MLLAALTLALIAQPVPDTLDSLRSVDVIPNIGLLLDASCSMRQNPRIPTECAWFASRYTASNLSMTKNEVMRAALVGCRSATDGILDKWFSQVNFTLMDFGRGATDATVRAPFGSSLADLKAAALAVPATGSTPITNALRADGRYFSSYLDNNNSQQCRPSYIVLLTDGDPNGGGATFDFNCPLVGDPRENLAVSANEPWLGASYMTRHRDSLCGVTGEQKIMTHAIGFGAPGSFNVSNLQRIATGGMGTSFLASNLSELDDALRQMIASIVAKSAIFYSVPTIEIDHLFSGNFIYTAAFRPARSGPWTGTVKKHCVEPPRRTNGLFSTNDKTCIFTSDDGKTLLTNPAVEDLWTGTTTTSATRGGSGLLLLDRLGAAGTAPSSSNLYPRKIMSWRPGVAAYVDVKPATWSNDDTFTTGPEHWRLVNGINGYTYAANATGGPLLVSEWPYGDAIHTPTVLLRYGPDCEVAGKCFVLAATNDGLLHVHDAESGAETSALVPAEIWRPTGVANEVLRGLQSQPDLDVTHRYYVDGGMSLFHDDTNGDGIIQTTETAYVVLGLGRGGSAYYLLPVSEFDGVFDATRNPVRPLTGVPGTIGAELRDTWATPWLGATEINGVRRRLAVFPTGHVRKSDYPTDVMPSKAETRARLGASTSYACPALILSLGLLSTVCGNYSLAPYTDLAASDQAIGPVSVTGAGAYRMVFSNIDIASGDKLLIVDSHGNTAATLAGPVAGPWTSPWVYDTSFTLRWITDGVKTLVNKGWKITSIETLAMIPAAQVDQNPGVWVTDLDKWNGASPRDFAASPIAGGNVLEIARRCTTSPEICVDASANPELVHMTCPISTEISVLTTADRISTLYWGDECGQLWKAWPTDARRTAWKARRLIKLNTTGALNGGGVAASKDLRKVFRRLDLVSSSCPGRKVTGVYFGTGNVQRPVAQDELANPTFSNGRDVVGVVWDSPALPTTLGLSNLADVTSLVQVDPRVSTNGWYWALSDDEKMLRDPLVFDGIAYFKTFRPTGAALECARSAGIDTIYAVDNCSAKPALEGSTTGYQVADRAIWSGNTDIGGNMMLYTPRTGAPMVSALNLARKENAALVTIAQGRVPRIYLWREPRDP